MDDAGGGGMSLRRYRYLGTTTMHCADMQLAATTHKLVQREVASE